MARRLALALLLMTLAGCQRNGLDQLALGERGRVVEVISGDAFALEGGQVVRLAGVDAPDRGQPYAEEARKALADRVQGKEVQLLYGGARRDSYGRALAHARLGRDRRWLQQAVLEEGAAWVRTYPDNRALAAEMLKAEQAARTGRKGVWALPAPVVRLPVEAAGQRGFQIVEGRVTAVEGSDLVLDGLIRAQVPSGRLADFTALKIDLAALKGQLVRVRGYLRRDGSLKLDHPEQLEPLGA